MADSRAFVHTIYPNSPDNASDPNTDPNVSTATQVPVNQSDPTWVLTFVRWENRDTLRVKQTSDPRTNPISVREPLVVENDCLALSTSDTKGTLTPNMTATLVMTDVNYETAVAPGDFVFVNILNWPSDARRVANQARSKQAINGANDGFKGFYKVQRVAKKLAVIDQEKGTRALVFEIQAFAFTEFNNSIYFNPYLITPQDNNNSLLFISLLGDEWKALVNSKGLIDVQNIIAALIQSLIGTGVNTSALGNKPGLVYSQNVHFFIPQLVGTLLGIDGATAAKDVYNYLFGIQKYAGGSQASLATGMNPIISNEPWNNFYYTSFPCPGSSFVKPEYWNNVKTWAILNQYTNSPVNELYTCFRIDTSGSVMPTVVFRQIPFTTEDFAGNMPVTKFMNLPRWKIDTGLIFDMNIGRDEAARVNFVQYFGRSTVGVDGADIAAEIAQKNYVYDVNDVQRSGLRPYIVTTQFDEPTSNYKDWQSPLWAQIVGDALIGGHLKFNGSITTVGIVDPIAVGDNLELDGTVYHIESVTHVCTDSPLDGKRIFRTTIGVSSGVSKSSSANGTRYSEMNYPNAYALRNRDWNGAKILPGVSESQDVIYRSSNTNSDNLIVDPNPRELRGATNDPFIQPNTKNGSQTGGNQNG